MKIKANQDTRGVKYIGALLDKAKFNFALASMRIYKRSISISGSDVETELWALSPSQAEHRLAVQNLGDLVEFVGPETTIPDRNPNHCSIAAALIVGEQQILLGADLEETGNEDHGWSAVVANSTRPDPTQKTACPSRNQVGSALSAGRAYEPVLKIGQPRFVRPLIGTS